MASAARATPATGSDNARQADSPLFSLSRRQLAVLIGGPLLWLACLSLGLFALARPELLPQSVVAAAPFLATSTPLPTRQVTRAAVTASTPVALETVCSRRAEFCLTFPGDWLVVDQGLPGGQREVAALAESYPWAPALFNGGEVPRMPRMRSAPANLVEPAAGRVARLTAGETDVLSVTLSLEQIESLIQAEPAIIAPLLGSPLQPDAALRRFERELVGGYESLATEFEAEVQLQETRIPVRIRIYFIPANDRLYTLSYLADQTTVAGQRQLFEQIVQSFVIEER